MDRMSNVKRRLITSMGAVVLLVLTIVGITYAYFTSRVKGNTNTKSAEVSAGRLELVYRDGNGLIEMHKIEPGVTLESKTFTVTNTGTALIDDYDVILEDVINELKYYEDLTYELTCTSTSGTCNGSNGIFPTSTASIVTNSIDVGVTHTYTLTVAYNETNTDQSDDMNKIVSAKVNIRDEYKNYTNLKIYGNSTTDGNTEIKSLGNLVTDINDNNYGKYKIDINVYGKNLYSTYGFSAQGISSPNATRSLSNPYGTRINTTNPSNSLTINQSVIGNSTNFVAYENGYFVIGLNDILKTDANYRLSFDLSNITKLNEDVNEIRLFPRGDGRYSKKIIINGDGRYSVVFNYFYYSSGHDYLEFRNEGMSFTISNIMITLEAETNTDYVPFEETLIYVYLKEPLRKLNDVADYIDVLNRKVVRYIDVDNSGNMSILATPREEFIQIIDSNELIDKTLEVTDGELEASNIISTYDK